MVESAVREELARIATRFEAGQEELAQAGREADRGGPGLDMAREHMEAAAAEFWSAGDRLSDLLLLLLRYGLRHRREQLHALLADALGPELEALAQAVLQGRKVP